MLSLIPILFSFLSVAIVSDPPPLTCVRGLSDLTFEKQVSTWYEKQKLLRLRIHQGIDQPHESLNYSYIDAMRDLAQSGHPSITASNPYSPAMPGWKFPKAGTPFSISDQKLQAALYGSELSVHPVLWRHDDRLPSVVKMAGGFAPDSAAIPGDIIGRTGVHKGNWTGGTLIPQNEELDGPPLFEYKLKNVMGIELEKGIPQGREAEVVFGSAKVEQIVSVRMHCSRINHETGHSENWWGPEVPFGDAVRDPALLGKPPFKSHSFQELFSQKDHQ